MYTVASQRGQENNWNSLIHCKRAFSGRMKKYEQKENPNNQNTVLSMVRLHQQFTSLN